MLAALCTAVARGQTHWPAQLEADVKTQNWDAAVRVGSAIVEEIEAGRMFTLFTNVPEEVRARRLYADALQHTGKSGEARGQLEIARLVAENREGAPGYARRLANLKSSVLRSAIDQPSSLPPGAIVVFWAKWCAVCGPEMDALSNHSRTRIVRIDVDHMDPSLRKYVPIESLESAELPQLYVVDARGRIRFHVSGYEDDGFFLKKLDWMIDAAKN